MIVSIERKQNKGFTLIELIIAIAMLAFLMTAVSAFMVSGIVNFKKAKADVRVHNSAQENYDLVSDAIMEAKDIYLFGYISGDNTLYCFVRDDSNKESNKQESNISNVQSQLGMTDVMGTDTATTKYFSDIKSTDVIYIKALVIDTAEPITESEFITLSFTDGKVHNNLTNADVEITVTNTDSYGNTLYSEDDTVRQMFVFEDENMYYMTKYAYVTSKNDNIKDAVLGLDAKKSDYLYSSSFEITEEGYTNCIAAVDVDNGAMSVDFIYSDKNMTYTTKGMIKFRNSYVIKAKKGKEV